VPVWLTTSPAASGEALAPPHDDLTSLSLEEAAALMLKRLPAPSREIFKDREFTNAGLVKGGLAIWHVVNLHIENGTSCITVVNCAREIHRLLNTP
jgi:hypothetical protein